MRLRMSEKITTIPIPYSCTSSVVNKQNMKNNPNAGDAADRHLEILKTVAQAWHSHSGTSKPANEFDAHRRNFKGLPSRFKLEAAPRTRSPPTSLKWDFRQSLWDSYELVTVSKRLEAGLVMDGNSFDQSGAADRVHRRQRESSNSLRSLFNRVSSRRFKEPNES